MSYLFQTNSQDISLFGKNWLWFFMWGIILIILGIVAISVTTLTTLISVIFLGTIIFISGIVIIADAAKVWWGRWKNFLLHLIVGALYTLFGLMLMVNPAAASVSLTLLLGILYLLLGIFRLTYSLSSQLSHWGWGAFSGLLSLLLGILIITSWPASSLFIIGLFVGIDLLVCGWVYVMSALTAKAVMRT